MHGYELRTRLNLMLGWGRVLSYGSLYPTLKKMLRAGLIEESAPTRTPVSRRPRITYEVTEAGTHEFERLMSEVGPTAWEDDNFDIRFAFFSSTDMEIRLRVLEGRRTRLQERLERVQGQLSMTQKEVDRYAAELQRHGVESVEREVRWLYDLINAARDGSLKEGGTIVEPTSGNTGIGLAMTAAVKGYKLVLVMPESMSVERRRLMLAYGATFDLTPKEKGMKGAIERAQELVEQTEGAWMPSQFDNESNWKVHARTTAKEILDDFADTPIDAMITGVGPGGHLTGCAEVLKQSWSAMKAYAVEPQGSPVISGGQPGPHPIQGIGAGFVPDNLHTQAIDGAIQVDPEDAKEMARQCAAKEGLLVGISSGATLAAIKQKLAELPAGSRVLGFNYDTGERYLSVPDFLPE